MTGSNNRAPNGFLCQSAHTLVTKGVVLGLSVAAGMLAARLLGTSGRGALALFQTVPLMVMPLGELGVRQAAAHFLGQRRYTEQALGEGLKLLYLLGSVLGAAITLACYAGLGLWRSYGWGLPCLFAALVPLLLLESYYNGILLAQRRIERMNYLSLADRAGMVLFLVLFVAWGRYGVMGAALALLASRLLPTVLLAVWLREHLRLAPRWVPSLSNALLMKGGLFALSLFVMQLNYRVDVLMLERVSGMASVGIYSVGVTVCELLKELPLAIGLVLFARSANARLSPPASGGPGGLERVRSMEELGKVARVTMALIAVIALGLAVAAPWVIPWCYGAEFAGSVRVIWCLLPGVMALALFLILQFFAAGQGKPGLVLRAFVPALILNILLNLAWIPRWHEVGAALSSTVSYALAVWVYLRQFSRLYGITAAELLWLRASDVRDLMNRWRYAQTRIRRSRKFQVSSSMFQVRTHET